MSPIPPYRHAMPPPRSGATGMSRTACTTPAMSLFRRISLVSVATQASSPDCAPSPTTSCGAIRLQRSIRTAMPPLSAASTRSSSGALVESVEQPCGSSHNDEPLALVACGGDATADFVGAARAGERLDPGIVGHRTASGEEANGRPADLPPDPLRPPVQPLSGRCRAATRAASLGCRTAAAPMLDIVSPDITNPRDQCVFLMFQNSANGVSRMSVAASRDTSGVKYSPSGTNGTVCTACS